MGRRQASARRRQPLPDASLGEGTPGVPTQAAVTWGSPVGENGTPGLVRGAASVWLPSSGLGTWVLRSFASGVVRGRGLEDPAFPSKGLGTRGKPSRPRSQAPLSPSHGPAAAMGRGICPHGPTLAPSGFDRRACRHQGRPVRAAAPRGCGRRRASPSPPFAFCVDDALARGQRVRLGSGEDAAFASADSRRAAAQSEGEGISMSVSRP